MNYRVEIVPDTKAGTTHTFVWKGAHVMEHKVIEEIMHDTKANRETVLKSYHANKGEENDGD